MGRLTAALLAALAVAGCSREEESPLPAACRLGPEAVERALRDAPGPVRLEGDTRLSECFVRKSEQADVLLVGEVMLAAASRLADDGSAVELGYLLGAARRGTGDTQGIYYELVRRLEQEAARLAEDPGLRRGERAGRESG